MADLGIRAIQRARKAERLVEALRIDTPIPATREHAILQQSFEFEIMEALLARIEALESGKKKR